MGKRFKALAVAAVTAAAVAFSASPASASPAPASPAPDGTVSDSSYGWSVKSQALAGGCFVNLEVEHPSSGVYWARARVGIYSYGWTCRGYAKNTAGNKSWTGVANVHSDSWSGGVWDGDGYKAWACVYAYQNGVQKASRCTSWW